jgi:putative transposase
MPAFHMLKLNQRKIRWIVREVEKGYLSIRKIAKTQGITPRHVIRVYKKYKGNNIPKLKPCGSKPIPITEEERKLVIDAKKDNPLGAVNLEAILKEDGVFMGHNKIHKILKKEGLAKDEPKKKNQRKWVRYERRHSNSLWHADWAEEGNDKVLLIEDDASRFLAGFGVFPNATTENSVALLEKAIQQHGTPRQLMTDHGTPFVSIERENCPEPEPNAFEKFLKEHKIKHIKARVKHPQSNGKVERLVQTIKKHKVDFGGSWDKAVEYYNFRRPHMSLYNGHTRTPHKAYLDKMRK